MNGIGNPNRITRETMKIVPKNGELRITHRDLAMILPTNSIQMIGKRSPANCFAKDVTVYTRQGNSPVRVDAPLFGTLRAISSGSPRFRKGDEMSTIKRKTNKDNDDWNSGVMDILEQNKQITQKVMVLTQESEKLRDAMKMKEKEKTELLEKNTELKEKLLMKDGDRLGQERRREGSLEKSERKRQELHERIDELQKELTKAEWEREEAKRERCELQMKLNCVLNENERVITLYEAISGDKLAIEEESYQKEIDYRKKVSELENGLLGSEQKLKQLEIAQLWERIEQERSAIELMERRSQIEELLERIAKMKEEREQFLRERIEQEKSAIELKERRLQIEELHEKIAKLKVEIERFLRERIEQERSAIELKERRSQIEQLLERIAKMKEERELFLREKNQREEEIERISKELSMTRITLLSTKEELERDFKICKEKLEARESECERQHRDLKQQGINLANCKENEGELEKQVKKLKETLKNMQDRMDNQDQVLHKKEKELQKKSEELVDQNEISKREQLKVIDNEELVNQLGDVNKELKARVKELENRCKEHLMKEQHQELKIQQCEETTEGTLRQLKESRMIYSSLQLENKEILEFNSKLKKNEYDSIETFQKERFEQESKLKEVLSENEKLFTVNEQLRKQQDTLQEEIDIKKKLLLQLQKENQSFRTQINALPQVEKLHELIDTQNKQNSQLLLKLQQTQTLNQQLQNEKEEALKVQSQLKLQMDEQTNIPIVNSLKQQVNQLKESNLKLSTENNSLYDLLKLRKQEISVLHDKIDKQAQIQNKSQVN